VETVTLYEILGGLAFVLMVVAHIGALLALRRELS
jgi:hypothetical protein